MTPTPEQIEDANKIVESVYAIARTTNADPQNAKDWVLGFLATRDARIIAEARAEVWEDASILADKKNCPVMRDDCERGYYRACEQITEELKARGAAERAKLWEGQ